MYRIKKSLKAILIVGSLSLLFVSCKSKEDRIEEIKILFPNAELIDLEIEENSGWRFLVNDTISERMLFVECYSDGEKAFREFTLSGRK